MIDKLIDYLSFKWMIAIGALAKKAKERERGGEREGENESEKERKREDEEGGR